jgi:hypothetical protein
MDNADPANFTGSFVHQIDGTPIGKFGNHEICKSGQRRFVIERGSNHFSSLSQQADAAGR